MSTSPSSDTTIPRRDADSKITDFDITLARQSWSRGRLRRFLYLIRYRRSQRFLMTSRDIEALVVLALLDKRGLDNVRETR